LTGGCVSLFGKVFEKGKYEDKTDLELYIDRTQNTNEANFSVIIAFIGATSTIIVNEPIWKTVFCAVGLSSILYLFLCVFIEMRMDTEFKRRKAEKKG
jgi:hypothetical protein